MKDQVILITGGSSGLGKAMAELAIEQRAVVYITGRDQQKLNRVANEMGAEPLHADMTDEASLENGINTIMDKHGRIDVLINNAGIGNDWPEVTEVSHEAMLKTYEVNVFGVAVLTAKVASVFKKQKCGSIVNIASSAGVKGFARGTVYASSKFALRGMTQCWQAELRPYNVRVILVNPSEVPTAFNQEDRSERALEPNKLRPTEIAHAVISALRMDPRGFIPELSVWATNPF